MEILKPIFLRARWEDLLLINYVVDPDLLRPYVPFGTELDLWNGRCYASLVGFMFLDTRVLGISIPFHRDFEEFNLRFYVKFRQEGEERRGVVFIREIVPRTAIAPVANHLYGEHYLALAMDSERRREGDRIEVKYGWRFKRRWNYVRAVAENHPQFPEAGSEAEFIAEHYWGCTRLHAQRTSLYRVEHPPWRICAVRDFDLEVDVQGLYGPAFAPMLDAEPSSVFLAEGSEVLVRHGRQFSALTGRPDGQERSATTDRERS